MRGSGTAFGMTVEAGKADGSGMAGEATGVTGAAGTIGHGMRPTEDVTAVAKVLFSAKIVNRAAVSGICVTTIAASGADGMEVCAQRCVLWATGHPVDSAALIIHRAIMSARC